MDRLLEMDKQEYVSRMLQAARPILEQMADAINAAPTGRVIDGSEMPVRDLAERFRQRAFEMGVQMRIDSTESSFSPSGRRAGPPQAEQGARRLSRL